MKGYKTFITIFCVVFAIYIIAELNKPKPLDWTITLSKSDKNPYGGYIVFNHLKDVFPGAAIQSYRRPVYNQVNNYAAYNNAYLIISDEFKPSEDDVNELLDFAEKGNSVFVSASSISKVLLDTLNIETNRHVSIIPSDSVSIHLVKDELKQLGNYTFKRMTIDEYFSSFDTAKTAVLGVNSNRKANFIKVGVGNGVIYLHSNPLVFSNYFILHQNNHQYTSAVLSHVPKNIARVFWDEYYKLGPEGARSPLRFFLNNEYLRWALRLAIIGLVIFVLFEMKRKQRVIPVIAPLRNSTVDFTKTVAGVYFQQKDNKGIADKKITYFLDYIRHHFYLATNVFDESFIEHLSRKSGVTKKHVHQLVQTIQQVQSADVINDSKLIMLNYQIDNFYKQVK